MMRMRAHTAALLLVGILPGRGWAFIHTPQGCILAARSRAVHASSLGALLPARCGKAHSVSMRATAIRATGSFYPNTPAFINPDPAPAEQAH